MRKNIVCFVGAPGSGKTTVIHAIRDELHGTRVHLKKYGDDLIIETQAAHDTTERSIHVVFRSDEERDTIIFEFLQTAPTNLVLLDGFPRSERQARRFNDAITRLQWNVIVIDLVLNLEESIMRQVNRATSRGSTPDNPAFQLRSKKYFTKQKMVLNILSQGGVTTRSFDAHKPTQVIHEQIIHLVKSWLATPPTPPQ